MRAHLESNQELQFWRLELYHLTMDPTLIILLFAFFVLSLEFAPTTILLKVNLTVNPLLILPILARPIVRALALNAIKFYQMLLWHLKILTCIISSSKAGMAERSIAPDCKSGDYMSTWVRIPLPASSITQ